MQKELDVKTDEQLLRVLQQKIIVVNPRRPLLYINFELFSTNSCEKVS